ARGVREREAEAARRRGRRRGAGTVDDVDPRLVRPERVAPGRPGQPVRLSGLGLRHAPPHALPGERHGPPPARVVGRAPPTHAVSSPLSSVVSVLRYPMYVDTVVASSWRSPLAPMSHQNRPWAPSTMAITAWARSSAGVGSRESLVNWKNWSTVQTGRLGVA